LRQSAGAPSIAIAVKRSLLLCSLALFASCSEDATARHDANPADANPADANQADADAPNRRLDPLDDSDCNLQTVLVAGIPGSPGNLIKSERNPNGDSELAVVMRLFVDGLRDSRLMIEAGEPVKPLFPVHRVMRCAWPTVPSERDEGYDARSKAYLNVVRYFDESPSKDTYNAIVSNCVACHQVSCGGVIEFIESLRWE
jgi:hypothetical protein